MQGSRSSVVREHLERRNAVHLLEPLGEDFWIAPSQALMFTAASSGPEVDCIWHAQGVSVWMGDADAYGFTVTTDAGDVVECGYQRPPGAFDQAP